MATRLGIAFVLGVLFFDHSATGQEITLVLVRQNIQVGSTSGNAVEILVRHDRVPLGYWIGVSIKRPDGIVEDLPPERTNGSGITQLWYQGSRANCTSLAGHQFAVAVWRTYDGQRMSDLAHRFRDTTWIPLACGDYVASGMPPAAAGPSGPALGSTAPATLRQYALLFDSAEWERIAQESAGGVVPTPVDSLQDLLAQMASSQAGAVAQAGSVLETVASGAVTLNAGLWALYLENLHQIARARRQNLPAALRTLASRLESGSDFGDELSEVQATTGRYQRMIQNPEEFDSSGAWSLVARWPVGLRIAAGLESLQAFLDGLE